MRLGRAPAAAFAVFFLLVAPLLLGAVPTAQAATPPERQGVLSACDSGATSTSSVFETGGEATDCTVSLDNHAVVDNAWVDLTIQGTRTSARSDPFDRTPDAFPVLPYLDVGNDGTLEWAFNTTRTGPLGHTTTFLDGSSTASLDLKAGESGTLSFEVPSNAEIRNATITLSGDPTPYWREEYAITNTSDLNKSAEGPFLAAFNNKLFAAWATDDPQLITGGPDMDVVVRSYDGTTWSPAVNLSPGPSQDNMTDTEVLMQVYHGKLWVIWSAGHDEGVEGLTNLTYRTTDDGVTWSALGRISPTVTNGINTYLRTEVFQGRLYFVWKTTDSHITAGRPPPTKDLDIVSRWYDGDTNSWGNFTEITDPANGTLDWFADIKAFQGKLYVAWQASPYDPYAIIPNFGKSDILMRVFDGNSWGPITVPSAEADLREGNIEDSLPIFSIYRNPITGLEELYLVWMRGESAERNNGNTDYDVAYRMFNGAAWTTTRYLTEPNDTDDDMFPCLQEYNGVLYAFWISGVNTTVVGGNDKITLIATYGDLVYRAYNGRDWSAIKEITHNAYLDNVSHPSCAVFNGRLFAAWESPTNLPVGGPAWDVAVRNIDFDRVQLHGIYGGVSENYSATVGLNFSDTPYPFNLSALNSLLGNRITSTDEFGNTLSQIDLRLTAQTGSVVQVSRIDVRYDVTVRVNITDALNDQLDADRGDLYQTHYIDSPLTVGIADGGGRININQLHVEYRIDYPPQLVLPLSSISILEDSGAAPPIDLNEYFTDDWDAGRLRFEMSNATNTQHVMVDLQGSTLRVGTLTANWCGVATFQIWAYDRNDYYANSNEVAVFVECVNDPPVLTPLSDVNISADQVYSGDTSATDPDVGDILTFTTDSPWVELDPITGAFRIGAIQGTPDTFTYNITVTDLAGASDTGSATFHVERTVTPPVGTERPEDVTFPYWLLLLLLAPLAGYVTYRARAWRMQTTTEFREEQQHKADKEDMMD